GLEHDQPGRLVLDLVKPPRAHRALLLLPKQRAPRPEGCAPATARARERRVPTIHHSPFTIHRPRFARTTASSSACRKARRSLGVNPALSPRLSPVSL